MEYSTLLTELTDGIFTITINRPDKLNALNKQVFTDLEDVMHYVYDTEEIKAVIITGSGTKAFVAGADITEFLSLNSTEAKILSANGQRIFSMIESCPKPVIAAVNGFALGGGCELAMSCHLRVASENAKFGQPEINLGLIPGYGGTQRLARYVGKAKALELLLTADMLTAADALQWQLVNYVCTSDELIGKCKSILDKIKTKSPLVIDQLIACTNSYFEKAEDGFELEIDEFGKCFSTSDLKEGVNSFLEKRKAVFTGK